MLSKHAPLKPFAVKPWLYYTAFRSLASATRPHGTPSLPLDSTGSRQSMTRGLNIIDSTEDGAGSKDQVGPSFGSATPDFEIGQTFSTTSSFGQPLFDSSQFFQETSQLLQEVPSAFPLGSFNFSMPVDMSLSQEVPTVVVSTAPPLSASSAAGSTSHPQTSSLSSSIYPRPLLDDLSITSASSPCSLSDAGTGSSQKRKFNTQSDSGMQPPSSKRMSMSRTEDLNPAILTHNLNSTLARLADIIERSLDVTAAAAAAAVAAPLPSVTPSDSQTPHSSSYQPQLPVSSSSSSAEDLDTAIKLATGNITLTEDELFAASVYFTNQTNDTIRTARTFIQLEDNKAVQRRFLLNQLNQAGLLN